jgi:pimeloyl-ACP methyl ester carboxylesterase
MNVVFLHYFGGSARSWDAVLAQLSGGINWLALDVPGFGDAPPLSAHQTVSEVAAALAGQIRAWVGSEPVWLVGHSMSGKLALALAAGLPNVPTLLAVQGLLLVAPSPPGPEPIPNKTRQQLLSRPQQPPAERERTASETAETITNMPLSEAARQRIITDNLRASDEGWVAWAGVGSREDISYRMGEVNVPVHILAGDCDQPLPLLVQYELVLPLLPHAQLGVVAGGGHLLPLEAPEQVANWIERTCATQSNSSQSTPNPKPR